MNRSGAVEQQASLEFFDSLRCLEQDAIVQGVRNVHAKLRELAFESAWQEGHRLGRNLAFQVGFYRNMHTLLQREIQNCGSIRDFRETSFQAPEPEDNAVTTVPKVWRNFQASYRKLESAYARLVHDLENGLREADNIQNIPLDDTTVAVNTNDLERLCLQTRVALLRVLRAARMSIEPPSVSTEARSHAEDDALTEW